MVVFSRLGGDPVAAIAHAVAAAAGVEPRTPSRRSVERACAARGDVYLLLDQAEEYFLYHPEGGPRARACRAGRAALRGSTSSLALRDDALAKLDRFKAPFPGILGNYLRLDRLYPRGGPSRGGAPLLRWRELGGDPIGDRARAHRGGARPGGGGPDPRRSWRRGRGCGRSAEERIEAPYLQLVMERLWEVEREQESSVLRTETLEALGGAAQIVAAHLERAMDALSPGQQETASELLRQLVTPSGAKIAHAASDLAGYANVPEDEATVVLRALAERRILRPGDDGRFEIYHDVLAAPVLAWRARYVQSRALLEAHRRNRRLALVAGVSLAALALTVLVAVFALVQRSNARDDARTAHARELDAAAASLFPTDPELGLLLARDSAVSSPTPTAEDVLRQALTTSRLRRVIKVGKPLFAAAAVEPMSLPPRPTEVFVSGRRTSRTVAQGTQLRVRRSLRAATSSSPESTVGCASFPDEKLAVPKVAGARGAEMSRTAKFAAVRFSGRAGRPRRRSGSSTATRAPCFSRSIMARPPDRLAQRRRYVARHRGRRSAGAGLAGPERQARAGLQGHVGPSPRSHSAGAARSSRRRAPTASDASGDLAGGRPVSVLSGHTNYLSDMRSARTDPGRHSQPRPNGANMEERNGKGPRGVPRRHRGGASARSASGHEIVPASLDGTRAHLGRPRAARAGGRRRSSRTGGAARFHRGRAGHSRLRQASVPTTWRCRMGPPSPPGQRRPRSWASSGPGGLHAVDRRQDRHGHAPRRHRASSSSDTERPSRRSHFRPTGRGS